MAHQNGPKVFGIGLGRTGRASLTQALNHLGIEAKHVNDDHSLQRQLLAGDRDLRLLGRYQGIVGGIAPFFRELDVLVPGSKFILTVRNTDDWLAERRRMAELEATTFARLHPEEREAIASLRRRVYGSAEFDAARYLETYERHVTDVRAYFKGRSASLLAMDIPGGDGWEVLCPFLGKPTPPVPFPHRNSFHAFAARHAEMAELATEIATLIPPGQRFILVDDGALGFGDGRALPFLEREGRHWGPPPDDATAISELERMRREGAGFIAFASTSFWWLDHYAEFHRYLRSEFRRYEHTDRFIVFDMRR